MSRRMPVSFAWIALVVASSFAFASPSAAWLPTLQTICWRTDCTGYDPGECVDSPDQDHSFHFWIFSVRKPSASSPLLIDVSSGARDSFTGDVRVFGSAIRSGSLALPGGHPAFDESVGVSVSGGGQFHMHGGIINSSASNFASADATGLEVSGSGSFGHTPGTAFTVKPGASGTGTRASQSAGGDVQSPFLWQAGTAPPVASLASAEGEDMYVEFDCGADGDCDAGGSQAHIMLYNPTECPAELWFDSTTGRCRNDVAP